MPITRRRTAAPTATRTRGVRDDEGAGVAGIAIGAMGGGRGADGGAASGTTAGEEEVAGGGTAAGGATGTMRGVGLRGGASSIGIEFDGGPEALGRLRSLTYLGTPSSDSPRPSVVPRRCTRVARMKCSAEATSFGRSMKPTEKPPGAADRTRPSTFTFVVPDSISSVTNEPTAGLFCEVSMKMPPRLRSRPVVVSRAPLVASYETRIGRWLGFSPISRIATVAETALGGRKRVRDELRQGRSSATVPRRDAQFSRDFRGGGGPARDVPRAAGMASEVPLVVVADRDRLHERLVTTALSELGYDVVPVRTAWELQHVVATRTVDALLVDLAMFGSSIAFLNSVVFVRRPLLVVLMLALGTGMTPEVARSSGFDACFSKIIDVPRLDRFLRDHLPLSRRPPRVTAARGASP